MLVEKFDSGMVRIHHIYPELGRVVNGALWMNVASASWLAMTLFEVIHSDAVVEHEFSRHDDELRVLARGSADRPAVQIRNRRATDVTCPGMWVLIIDALVIPELLTELLRFV